MAILRRVLALLYLGAMSLVIPAGEPSPADLQPTKVKFSATELALDQALKELQKETGNVVLDRRVTPGNPKVTLPADAGAFWPTLDTLCKEAKVGYNVYQAAMVDSPAKDLKASYSGLFRFTVKQMEVTRFEEDGQHLCRVTLDTAWEPRFHALYVNLSQATAVFGKRTVNVDSDSAFYVARTRATDKIVLKMQAPPRATLAIDSIKGAIRVVGSPKLLDFAMPTNAKDKKVTQEGVEVSLTQVDQNAARWTVKVRIAYPAEALGVLDTLESFQRPYWRGNNRVWLTWTDRGTKKTHDLEPSSTGGTQEADLVTTIQFHFTPRGDTPLPGTNADVTLHYQTPNRVAAFTVPFEFRGLPLP